MLFFAKIKAQANRRSRFEQQSCTGATALQIFLLQYQNSLKPKSYKKRYSAGTYNVWPIIMIDNQAAPASQIVDISNITVDATTQQAAGYTSGQFGSTNQFFGIGYHNASGTIENIHVTETRNMVNLSQLTGGDYKQ